MRALSPILLLAPLANAFCECGYILPSKDFFTHRLTLNFTSSEIEPAFKTQSWSVPANRTDHILPRQNSPSNIWVSDDLLHLRQRGYNGTGPVSTAELQSSRSDFFHGSFRVRSRITGGEGSVAGFFFYHSDVEEIDIEMISSVDGDQTTIHYTNHPSYDMEADVVVQGASFEDQLERPWTEMQEYRFDWTDNQTSFYQDGKRVANITTNVPDEAGKIIFNLWANNGSWSGPPSETDVNMEIEYIDMYFNTTASEKGEDAKWEQRCAEAAESEDKVCGVDGGTSGAGALAKPKWWWALAVVAVVGVW